MISAAPKLGAKRQVFFVSLGGFDTHDAMLTAHPGLMTSVADAHGRVLQERPSNWAWPTRSPLSPRPTSAAR